MNIEFSDESYLDIEDAIIWYETLRKGLSIDFQLCLEIGIDEILNNPNNFQKRYSYVKIHFIKRFPYGIHFYQLNEKTIRVIGVIHTSRSPQIWFDRI